ncbi:exodeoxyribonuclease 7 large subunit [Alicyclobacillus hesperidum]|uniref:Exodeoxyribonuclease 7 large subunit n=1 Tax=Alicyclobacillus hesperidum TaxID=89784 RepID=A0A1H2T3U7_9BACL|nr:exodeoxyribonuclease VII large subunit [Alicyclobacillus hesperidum]GLV13750.1 exodeoxyribonuclease 7 large subunit [Alicyclobacillus hesperidum]SDW38613.1 Exodeoxyribonuclease VII large subunit [Alicyclobacillus hesperidum]
MSEAARSPSSATVFTVTELNLRIKRRIETDPTFAQCYVAGEISNFKHHSSGHMYFTLKDETSRIRAVMFAGRNRRLRFKPEDGMRVIALGTVSVFDRDGQYQLYVDDLQPDGIGALYVRFEQLRNQLQAEGLFAAERKRKLPAYPKRIGVVTSATGAVIRDICTTLERRYPLARVILAPAQVQGVTAARTIVAALERLWQLSEPVDVIIVGRGGGSLEELWPFNEEEVARAVARSPVPIVSAVGHETDVTICDYVADVRAATPTAAAELVAPHRRDLQLQLSQALARSQAAVAAKVQLYRRTLQQFENRPLFRFPSRLLMPQRQAVDFLEGRLRESFRRPTAQARRRLDELERRLHRVDLRHGVGASRHRIERLESRLGEVLRARMARSQADLDRTIAALEALNPLAVLRRGYSLVLDEAGRHVLASVEQLTPGRDIQIQVADGIVQAEVKRHGSKRERNEQIRLDI